MSVRTPWRALALVAGLAIVCAAVVALASPVLGADSALRLWVGIVAFSHCAASLATQPRQRGALTALVALATALVAAVWLLPSLADVALAGVAMAWALRSLFRPDLSADPVIDLVLTALGTAFAAFALDQTSSVLVSTWCYGLVQVVAFQTFSGVRRSGGSAGRVTSFEQAERRARDALAALGHRPADSTTNRSAS